LRTYGAMLATLAARAAKGKQLTSKLKFYGSRTSGERDGWPDGLGPRA
jgi:hypothetical protein